MNKHKHKKGFTAIELLIIVGFVASATAGTYGIYNYASDKQKVNAEFMNLYGFKKKIENSFITSDYSDLSNSKLFMMGIPFVSRFDNVFVTGVSKDSFKVNYNSLTARQCNNLALKAISIKQTSVKVGGFDVKNNIEDIAKNCDSAFNSLDIVFNYVKSNDIVEVEQGKPKPPLIYADEGSFIPERPVFNSNAIAFAELVNPTEIPLKTYKGVYVQPVSVQPEEAVLYPDDRPLYNANIQQLEQQAPIEGIITGEDTTNIRPAIPTPPPPPPPTAQPIQTGIYNFRCNVAYNMQNYIFCLNAKYESEFKNRTSIQGISVNDISYKTIGTKYPTDRAFRAFGSRYIEFNGKTYDVNELYKTHRLYYLEGTVENNGDHYQGYLYGMITFQLCEINSLFTYKGKNIQCL